MHPGLKFNHIQDYNFTTSRIIISPHPGLQVSGKVLQILLRGGAGYPCTGTSLYFCCFILIDFLGWIFWFSGSPLNSYIFLKIHICKCLLEVNLLPGVFGGRQRECRFSGLLVFKNEWGQKCCNLIHTKVKKSNMCMKICKHTQICAIPPPTLPGAHKVEFTKGGLGRGDKQGSGACRYLSKIPSVILWLSMKHRCNWCNDGLYLQSTQRKTQKYPNNPIFSRKMENNVIFKTDNFC